MTATIIFKTRDELLRLSAGDVVCFAANDNTTEIVLLNGERYMVCMSLNAVEKALTDGLGAAASRFARVGRSHIINLPLVRHIHVPRRRVVLSEGLSKPYVITVSSEAIKALKRLFS